jgi:thermitase
LNGTTRYVDKEVMIKVKKNYNKERIEKYLMKYNFTLVKRIDKYNWTKAEYNGNNFIQDFYNIKNGKMFENTELNMLGSVLNYPNDPKYLDANQWYIYNNKDRNTNYKSDADIDILEAWDITKGDENIVIAILDSGIPTVNGYLSHEDLSNSNRILLGVDYINDTSSPFNDTYKHGTGVAGIAGAETDNGVGIAGIAPNCKLMIYKICNATGNASIEGAYNAITDIINCKNQNPNLKFVINISMGWWEPSSLLENAISLAHTNNILVVSGAGNETNGNADIRYPAKYSNSYENLIAVSATNSLDSWADFSSYGPEVTVSAPGKNIYTTWPSNGYSYKGGTSYASPMVAGLAALMLSIDQTLSPSEVKNRIINSSHDFGSSGHDHYYGHGRINAFNTLAQLLIDKQPEFTLYAGNLNLSLQASNFAMILAASTPVGVAAGRYSADRYIATKSFSHSLVNSSTWYLGMQGYEYTGGSGTNDTDYYLSENVGSNSFTFTTYFYYIKYDLATLEQINKWVPWNPYVEGGLEYAVLGNNAPLSATITGPTRLNAYQTGTWQCNPSGGKTPYSYTWYYMYPSDAIIKKPEIGTWKKISNESSVISRYDNETFHLKCVVTDNLSTVVTSNIIVVNINGLNKSNNENGKSLNIEYALEANYPNPFNPQTSINYSIKEKGFVSLKVFNTLGEEVASLVDEVQEAGKYSAQFDASHLSSGLYLYRLQTGKFVQTKKMILLK